jgi:hypothetical protein
MQPGVTLILGKSFTGKTARLLHELRRSPRVVLADPKCAQLAALPRYAHLWPEFNGEKWETSAVPNFFADCLYHKFRAVVHVRHHFKEQLNALCYLLMRVKNLTLAVDELGLFAPPGPAQVLGGNLTAVIVSGRHEGISFVATVQRPSMVHKTALALANRMLVYRITEENDLDIMRGYLPDGFLAAVPFLPDYACIDWQDGREPFADYSLRGKLGASLPAPPAQLHL